MNKRLFKYTFFILSALILAALLLTSKDAGISGDEEVHYKHSEMVYQYFATVGKDKSSLHTPVTHLQYYGQAFDNLVTILIHWFSVDDIYGFRHLMGSVAGWLAIFFAGMLAVFLGGYQAGVITLVLFAVSPTFLGHAHNNLKDIPFAMAYIASVYFIAKVFFNNIPGSRLSKVLLALSIGLAIGIRPGGLLLIACLVFFVLLETAFRQWMVKTTHWDSVKKITLQIVIISVAGYVTGLLLWPYALQNPVVNPWKSYQVMTQFPTTIRQIFEGQFTWSDLLPWYYLPKSMLITIPVVVWLGFSLFAVLAWKLIPKNSAVLYMFLGFVLIFPPVFAIVKNVNLYGSWRHFLFIYPVMVVMAALGFSFLLKMIKSQWAAWSVALVILVLAIHPFLFMAKNHPYYYLYYNQFVGGLKNAYGNYETDYYYHTIRKGANWLTRNLKDTKINEALIGSNFMVAWHLRENRSLKPVYFTWSNRSETDWDYAIVANSYIPPYQLKNGIWPPKNSIYTIHTDGVPVCVVLRRESKADLEGIRAFREGDNERAIEKLKEAAKVDPLNESIYYYHGLALQRSGNLQAADSLLKRSLELNPQSELTLVALGKIAEEQGDFQIAASFYDNLLTANPKFYRGYLLRAKLYTQAETEKARALLKTCLKLNSRYVPAISALADTYRKSNPDIADKYDKLANSLK